ncbi:hypothetical protein C8J56DRAFT_1165533 [Mycena floridula]|nr:hypothetical protein C8J56DRAFT_1165533 [Mycena floridula]
MQQWFHPNWLALPAIGKGAGAIGKGTGSIDNDICAVSVNDVFIDARTPGMACLPVLLSQNLSKRSNAYFMPLDTLSTETMTVNNDAILVAVGPRKELFCICKKDCVLTVGAGVVWSRQRLPFPLSSTFPFSCSRINADWDLTILIQCQIDNTRSYPCFEDGSRLHCLLRLHVIHVALRHYRER